MRVLLVVLILLCLAPALVLAQEDAHLLTPGQTVLGVLDAGHVLRVYSVSGTAARDQRVQLQNTGVVPLVITVIDADGNPLDSPDPLIGGARTELDWTPAIGSTSYLMILAGEPLADHQGAFTVTLLPSLTLATVGTLQFDLAWQAGARLSLEVRDPQGQALHWRSLETDDNGTFSAGDSGDPIDCATFTPRAHRQTATWQPPSAGSYEILVHYIDGCEPSAPFTLTARLGSQEFTPLASSVQAGETYVSGLTIGDDAHAGMNAHSGLVSDNSFTIPTADLLAQAHPLLTGGAITDSISNAQPFRSYRFEGKSGESVSVEVSKTSGNLDTDIALIDSNGNLLALNDDRAEDSTDSAISSVRLRRAGTYLIVVTRYAQLLGATEGDFQLTVTGIES